MKLNIANEVAALQQMTVGELRGRFAEVFGEATPSGNRVWLVRRIIWRMQALAEGGLSERARHRAEDLANESDLRLMPPRSPAQPTPASVPPRRAQSTALPVPGTIITRLYKGEMLRVTVLADGFQFEGRTYLSLSAVAKAITGSHCSGNLFFRLNGKDGGR